MGPVVSYNRGEWVSFVKDFGMLPLSEGLIRPGRKGSAFIGGKFTNTTAIARADPGLRIRGDVILWPTGVSLH